jgi:hypothetical protein
MSSIHSSYAKTPGPVTKFTDIITGGYSDDYFVTGETFDLPIPFTVSSHFDGIHWWWKLTELLYGMGFQNSIDCPIYYSIRNL